MALFGTSVIHLLYDYLNMYQVLLCYYNISFHYFFFSLCTSISDGLYKLYNSMLVVHTYITNVSAKSCVKLWKC